MTPRIAIITNVIPDYRAAFYRRLASALGNRLTIYCQTQIPGMNLHVAHEQMGSHIRLVKSCSLAREQISWQQLPLANILEHDIYFFTGNPRVLSTVACATLLRAMGRAVVIWGQYHTAGASPTLQNIRLWWWRRFQYIFAYADWEIPRLRAAGFRRQTIVGMNNGLDQHAIEFEKNRWPLQRLHDWQQKQGICGRRLILSCARLSAKNRFELMIRSLPAIAAIFPDVLWIVIGNGSELQSLQRLAATLGVAQHVRWIGALHTEEHLAPWFLSADFLVHPGAIGLSLLHAYGYGLPVITHDDEQQQMPEFGALTATNKRYCFAPGNSDDLAKKICGLLDAEHERSSLAVDALAATENFNTDVMATRFLSMIDLCNNSPKNSNHAHPARH